VSGVTATPCGRWQFHIPVGAMTASGGAGPEGIHLQGRAKLIEA